jgi:hypothetical protein
MHRFAPLRIAAFSLLFLAIPIPAQDNKDVPAEKTKDENVIGIGVALPQNQSRHPVALAWEHTQLMRFLKESSVKKGDPRTFEVIALRSTSPKDAFRECPDKKCDFVVVATFVDSSLDSPVTLTPDGVRVNPPPLGLPLSRCCANLMFKILAPGRSRPVADGLVAAPEGLTDEDAPAEVVRLAASQIAKEVRKKQPPLGE